MGKIIWVTGTSASGKSLVINRFSQLIPNVHFLSDADEILELNKMDENHEYHFHPNNREAFILTSSFHFDESIKRIVKKIDSYDGVDPIIIEIARGKGTNKDIDLSYERMIDLIPEYILRESIIVYVKADWEVRKGRNELRKKKGFYNSSEIESFYVPLDALESFFRFDDFEKIKNRLHCKVIEIDNSLLSQEELGEKVSIIIKELYLRDLQTT